MNTSATLTTALLSALFAVAASEAEGGSRGVEMSAGAFEDRCEAENGTFYAEGDTLACQVDRVVIACDFIAIDAADCRWNGRNGESEVLRVLGRPDLAALPAALAPAAAG